MSSDPAFVMDDASALARRARALLAGAGIAAQTRRTLLRGDRVLLVDAGHGELERAARAGATQIVYVEQALALPQDRRDTVIALAPERAAGAVRVRTQLYFEALLPRLALALKTGQFLSAAPARKAAYVAHEDAAIVAAALLSSDISDPGALDITGPQTLTHQEVCSLASSLFGRSLQLKPVAPSALAEQLVQRGLSAEQATLSARCDEALLHLPLPARSDDGPRITGVASLSLTTLLRQAREELLAGLPSRRISVANPARASTPSCAPINAA